MPPEVVVHSWIGEKIENGRNDEGQEGKMEYWLHIGMGVNENQFNFWVPILNRYRSLRVPSAPEARLLGLVLLLINPYKQGPRGRHTSSRCRKDLPYDPKVSGFSW